MNLSSRISSNEATGRLFVPKLNLLDFFYLIFRTKNFYLNARILKMDYKLIPMSCGSCPITMFRETTFQHFFQFNFIATDRYEIQINT